MPETILDKNDFFDNINSYVKLKKLNVVYYFSPMSLRVGNKEYISKLKTKIPNLLDFSSVVIDDKMFKDCTHLNNEGALFFTDYFIRNILKDNMK